MCGAIRFEFHLRGEVNHMSERSKFLSSISATLLAAFLLAGGLSVLAQSGRRAKTPVPTPTATPAPAPTRTKSTEKETLTITLIVGIDRYSDVSDIPLQFYGDVLRSCTERLDDSKSVKIKPMSENMSISDAAHQAKQEKEAYVVSLQLRSDNTRVGFQTTRDLNDVYVDYTVFAPTTGKVVARGKTYQRAASLGGIITKQPTGRTTIGDNDYWLKQAARAAAEKILAALSVQVPSGPVALQH